MQEKKLIVFGSSVAWGQGASGRYGWAAQLTERLREKNWQVLNRSVCGDRTESLLHRVKNDVLAEKPDAVLVAVSLGNEGLYLDDKGSRCRCFYENMRQLLRIFREHGIQPLLTNVYPHANYTETDYRYVQKMNLALDELDVPVFNVGGCVDDLTGRWMPGCFADAGHPNDAGHAEMLSAIPVEVFEHLETWKPMQMQRRQDMPSARKSATSFSLAVSGDIRSFTLDFDSEPYADGTCVSLGDTLSLDYRNGELQLSSAGVLLNRRQADGRVRLTVRYHPFLREGQIFCGQTLFHTFSGTDLSPNGIVFHGNHAVCSNILLYRGRLGDRILQHLWNGGSYRSSLELFAVVEADGAAVKKQGYGTLDPLEE